MAFAGSAAAVLQVQQHGLLSAAGATTVTAVAAVPGAKARAALVTLGQCQKGLVRKIIFVKSLFVCRWKIQVRKTLSVDKAFVNTGGLCI